MPGLPLVVDQSLPVHHAVLYDYDAHHFVLIGKCRQTREERSISTTQRRNCQQNRQLAHELGTNTPLSLVLAELLALLEVGWSNGANPQ